MEHQRIADYLSSLEPDGDELCREMRTYAERHNVPVVRLETESFLRTMCAAKRPGRILEIGTAIAFSTIVMAQSCEAEIVTVESWEPRVPLAKENLRRAGLSDRVRLLFADAGEVLSAFVRDGAYDPAEEKGFDLVFLDAAKAQYIRWLPDIIALMNEGGLLISDNVLQDFTVMESRFTLDRRERTTHSRMREFLYAVKHEPLLQSSILPLGDGVSLSVKRGTKQEGTAK